jgi:hypothetical protein
MDTHTCCVAPKSRGKPALWVIFDRSLAGLPVGPFRFAPRADIPPDGDSDLVAHHPAREHGANREAIGELHFIGTTLTAMTASGRRPRGLFAINNNAFV